jgi:hypothetical protein
MDPTTLATLLDSWQLAMQADRKAPTPLTTTCAGSVLPQVVWRYPKVCRYSGPATARLRWSGCVSRDEQMWLA